MVARTLAATGQLEALITDAWYGPTSLPSNLNGRLRGRYHPELAGKRVETAGFIGTVDELYARAIGPGGWRAIMNRNQRFEEMAARRLHQLVRAGVPCDTVFAYSYAARGIFTAARSLGLTTVLGQIDPGPYEDDIVRDRYREVGQCHRYEGAPPGYWLRWRDEIALSDIVMANSAWSKKLLAHAGVPRGKLAVVPLAYDAPSSAQRRDYELPDTFTDERPLRLLFLGQVTLRKGIDRVLAAIQRMPLAPLRLDIVGDLRIDLPEAAMADPRIKLHRAVSRLDVSQFYQAADLFVFPTLSDGFGLTQLEALAHGLPVLASRHCGQVVTHGHDGFVLDEVHEQSIEAALRDVLERPARLARWRANARVPEAFSQASLAARLSALKVVN